MNNSSPKKERSTNCAVRFHSKTVWTIGTVICWFLSTTSHVVSAQTVAARQSGDAFIDTSEWVQSSSPISDGYTTQGYITETIIRGYRGRDASNRYPQQAVEFTNQPIIQPVTYAGDAGQPEKSLAPIPGRAQPRGVQYPTHPYGNGSSVVPAAYSSNSNVPQVDSLRSGIGNASSTRVNSTFRDQTESVQNHGSQRMPQQQRGIWATTAASSAGYPPSVARPPVVQPTFAKPAFVKPATFAQPTMSQANPYATTPAAFATPQYRAAPVYQPTSVRNCDPPLYATTQFVTPNPGASPGALRTYPQYNRNAVPRGAFSQPSGYGPQVRETWVPIVPLRSMPYGVYLGQGIVGQPVAYVDGEPVRNFLRYVFP